ncbi:ABC transporter ATP-binding protein [Spelaeicoccus albus]|uniref:Branched-chain amino acid transport system ATP-binding protein n=1 Tax=Spelaeicoccus albus TaxID=1280376 RepID=A0A7Z0D2I7_9MICO|nr:ABC transporter ATP-binding protein [Spelaeicoccus albus]NYI67682.1 branched-chain amino acid transport system ATP-binding protein [Spelaeicoccus albus]
MTNVLEIDSLYVNYGKVEALTDLTISVGQGEIVSLLGNNGAGKSSTLAAVSGVVRPRSGTITAFGDDITTMTPWRIVERGVVHVPEGRRIFSRLTVHENLLIGGYSVKDSSLIDRRIGEVYELLPRLAERRTQAGGTLSGGEQQMLAIGRAMVTGPKLLMLDEPSMGLAPIIVAQVMEAIRTINTGGTAVLLIEQNARSALKVAHRGYVIDSGHVTLEGSSELLRADSRVIDAYLGK